MKHTISGLILALLFFTATFCNPQATTFSKTDSAVSKKLDLYITALADAGRFDGAVLVARNDAVLLSKGYGTAQYEFSVPVTPETLFPIGSNTKQFTAAGQDNRRDVFANRASGYTTMAGGQSGSFRTPSITPKRV